MRNLTRLTAAALGAALAAATLTSLATAPALADPPPGTTPRPCDVAGIGDDSADFLFDQFSHDFNGQQGGNPQATCAVNPIRYLYSWDAAGGCTPNGSGVICVPAGGQNLFGCDTRGTMALNKINGTAPTIPFPLTSTTKNPVINPAFSAAFTHLLFDVVESPAGTIPGYLQPYLGPSGWACGNATAVKDLRHYGLRVLPAGTAPGDCGSAH